MSDEQTDEELAARAGAGDEDAFDAIMARYKSPISNFIYRMTGDEGGAQDSAQCVFVNVYKALQSGRYRPASGRFSTWLFQVARHAAIDALRRRKRHPLDFFSSLVDGGETLPVTGPSAAEATAAHDIGEMVAAAVARLPEDQRTVFILVEYQGLSYAETADVMKCTVKSVETRLYRAKHKLRTQLEPLLM